ncbi:DUF724 family protein [Senna tora]|uniref:DUF724 family protein n=1 Tax=Senna tora TaxID=362788 RepID=A0A834TYM9_9FABA|nr:DUF724 family protein [Senna tora]
MVFAAENRSPPLSLENGFGSRKQIAALEFIVLNENEISFHVNSSSSDTDEISNIVNAPLSDGTGGDRDLEQSIQPNTPSRSIPDSIRFYSDLNIEEYQSTEVEDDDHLDDDENLDDDDNLDDDGDDSEDIDDDLEEPPKFWPVVPITRTLCGIPHNPYYHLLRGYSELARRNFAAAWDRTFEDTVRQVFELNMEERNWARVSELWETMGEMQGMGYNVLPVRRRLIGMAELRGQKKRVELEMKKWMQEELIRKVESAEVGYEIFNLTIKKTEKEASVVRAQRETIVSRLKMIQLDDAINALAMKPLI